MDKSNIKEEKYGKNLEFLIQVVSKCFEFWFKNAARSKVVLHCTSKITDSSTRYILLELKSIVKASFV